MSGVTGSSNLVDLNMALHHETDRAALVSDGGDEAKAVWLPKAAVEVVHTGKFTKGTKRNGQITNLEMVTVTCPSWLAAERGLI